MKTKCAYCGLILSSTRSKVIYSHSGKLYCNLTCACEQAKDETRSEGEYIAKEILKGETDEI